MKETGYVEGQNVAIEYAGAQGSYDRLPALVADLVNQSRKVDVIVTTGRHPFGISREERNLDDPDRLPPRHRLRSRRAWVASLARPGGNLTGVSVLFNELMPKLT